MRKDYKIEFAHVNYLFWYCLEVSLNFQRNVQNMRPDICLDPIKQQRLTDMRNILPMKIVISNIWLWKEPQEHHF